MLKRIAHWIALTKAERNVILFLRADTSFRVRAFAYTKRRFHRHRNSITAQPIVRSRLSVLHRMIVPLEEMKEEFLDASGKLNINQATKQQLLDLPNRRSNSNSYLAVSCGKPAKFSSIGRTTIGCAVIELRCRWKRACISDARTRKKCQHGRRE